MVLLALILVRALVPYSVYLTVLRVAALDVPQDAQEVALIRVQQHVPIYV